MSPVRSPQLSVVVPVYNQEKTIVGNLRRLKSQMDQLQKSYEIICVVDGLTDKSLSNIRRNRIKNVVAYGYTPNRGKGHAVRFGMAKAKGKIIGFVDSGDLDYSAIPLLLEHMKWYAADAVVGSKRHPASKVIYPWQRRVLSWGFQALVRILFGLNVRDTQVGMKFFRRPVVTKVLPRLLVKQYAFDVEFLAVANYLGFKRIFEAPVQIKIDFGKTSELTSKNFIRNVSAMLWDTLAVFYRLKILRYYDDSNRSHWQPNMYLEW